MLEFTIERHGGTVIESADADLQNQIVDFNEYSARGTPSGT